MNDALNNIMTRRSCKNFKPDTVPADKIDQIIEAGLYAASGMGAQSAIILAATDKGTRDRLSALNRKYDKRNRPDPFYGAPVILAVLADKKIATHLYDGSLVIGNMLLAAHALGLGSCWIHRAKEVFADPEGEKILRDAGITGDYEGIGNCVIGFAETEPASAAPRREGRLFRV